MRNTITRRRTILAAVLASVLLLAACSNGSDEPAAAGGSTTTSPPSSSSSSSSSQGGGGRYGYGDSGSDSGETGSNSGGSDDVALKVSVANYQFTPATVKVDSGDAIELTNTNPQTPHTFTVIDENIDVSLDPGSSTTVTIDLPPGTYPFECKFHSSMGMRGTLKVS
ncbi:MAG TPA: cupredoxin domain-containing protein [Actinomycetota bacterium]|nr:cupredoxin domain-containing protein [Actinomycetota bacterium]